MSSDAPVDGALSDPPEVDDALHVREYLADLDAVLARREHRLLGDAALGRQRKILRELRDYLEAAIDLADLQREQPPAPLPLEAVGLFCMIEAER